MVPIGWLEPFGGSRRLAIPGGGGRMKGELFLVSLLRSGEILKIRSCAFPLQTLQGFSGSRRIKPKLLSMAQKIMVWLVPAIPSPTPTLHICLRAPATMAFVQFL